MDKRLTEQLPEMLANQSLMKELQVFPEYDTSIREVNAAERILQLEQIYKVYVPSEMTVEIYHKLYLALMRSLQAKEGNAAVRQRYENHKKIRNEESRGIIGGRDSFTIIGTSGIGKSSAIERAITLIADERILETKQPYNKVVPFIVCQCPHDCSVKSILLDILRKTDEVIESNYCEKAVKGRATIDTLIGTVSTVALNHIGVLVVDEIQNVVNHRNGANLIGILTQLINNAGISICMVGVPETEKFFEKTDYLARRAIGLRYEAFPYGKPFQDFCRIVYCYQFTKKAEPFSEALSLWLYEHSGGVMAMVVSLLHDAQEQSIISGKDCLDMNALNEVYKKRYRMVSTQKSIADIKHSTLKNAKKKRITSEIILQEKMDTVDSAHIISIADGILEAKEAGTDIVINLKRYVKISEVKL